MHFGVHAGLQNTSTTELQQLWRRIEDHGFEWISVWDHFYAADATFSKDGVVQSGYQCLEALTTHAALALTTTKVQCGSLVYCAGYRNPAVLAKAIATIDQLSGGRVVLGLGAGWHQGEYHAYGIPFPPVGERLRILEEALQCVRLLFAEEVANFEGEHFQLRDARLEPKPVQERLPIVVGGGGEKVTLRLAAQYADSWNIAFTPAETYRHKAQVLAQHCERLGRDPATLSNSVNVALAWKEDDLVRQFGGGAEYISASALKGSAQEAIDRIGEYGDAGADMVVLALRAPFDVDGLDRFAAEVLPAFA